MGMLQMTWQPSLLKLSKRKHGAPPLGLRNLGNTCYLNSVLQCLTYTPPLANICLQYLHSSICDYGSGKDKRRDCPFCILEKRIFRSLSIEALCDAPAKINSCLRIYSEHFCSGRQEDAHEFLRYVIDACHNTCLRLKKLQQQRRGKNGIANGGAINGTGDTVVKEIFGGALQSQVKCLSCGAESNKVDEIMDISLEIVHSGSLREALQKFFQPEILDGNNKYKCDNCKELVVARKQMSVLQAPNVLVIQLKRFEGIYGSKIDKPVTFDDKLFLSSHMCKGSQDQHPEYNLFGTIVHSGVSPDSGHYYSYIKDTIGRWYCCNDSSVSLSNLQEVLSERVYILFFSRTKQRPRAAADVMVNGPKSHESNGTRASIQKSLDKPAITEQVIVQEQETNKLTNGSKLFVEKSGCLEKQKSGNPFYSNSSVIHPLPNGIITGTLESSIRAVTPVKSKEGSKLTQETNASSASVDTVDINDLSTHRSQFINSTKSEVERGILCRSGNFSENRRTYKAHSPDSVKIAVKNQCGVENGFEASVNSMEKEKNDLLVKENDLTVKSGDVQLNERVSSTLGTSNGENGVSVVRSGKSTSVASNGLIIIPSSEKGPSSQDLQKIGIVGSNGSCAKRKADNDNSSISSSMNNKSRAEVEAIRELIAKKALMHLRSDGFTEEVHNLMRARKKLCQEENCSMTANEMKSELISDAKRFCIPKISHSLKADLVKLMQSLVREKRSSGT